MPPVRLIKHEAVKDTGSFEVKHPGGSEYFYFEDNKSRRLRPDQMTREEALTRAKAFAREVSARLSSP